MSQQGWPRGPRSGRQDDWWSQLYDPGSPDTGRTGSGDTLDDRYASVRRTVGPATAPGGAAAGRPERPEPDGRDGHDGQSGGRRQTGGHRRVGRDGKEDAGGGEPAAEEAEEGAQDSRPGGAGGCPAAEEREDDEECIPRAETGPREPAPDRALSPDDRTPSPNAPTLSADRTSSREPAPPPGEGGGASGPAGAAGSRAADAPERQARPADAPPSGPRARRASPPQPPGSDGPLPESGRPPGHLPAGGAAAGGLRGVSTGEAGAAVEAGAEERAATGGDGRGTGARRASGERLRPGHVGERPPTYEAEPATFPAADPSSLSELVPDTVLDGAHYGGVTLRAASLRGDSARHRGALRRDALLAARFGDGESALLLVAVAAGGRAATGGHRAAREICHAIGGVVGRSHARLAEDIRGDRRAALKSGLQRLTDRCYGRLRAQAAALELGPEEYTADLRCLLVTADPRCRTRVFFGAGAGGLFRLRSGAWGEVEPGPGGRGDVLTPRNAVSADDAAGLDALDPSELGDPAALSVPLRTSRPGSGRDAHREAAPPGPPDPRMPSGPAASPPAAAPSSVTPPSNTPPSAAPQSAGGTARPPGAASAAPYSPPTLPHPARPEPEPFRFCATAARRGDVLLLCSPGLADPMRAVPGFAQRLGRAWHGRDEPPGLAEFLADVQLRVRGYAEDRTAVAVWED